MKECSSHDKCILPERRFPTAEQYSWQQCGWCCWTLSRKHGRWLVQNGAGALRWMVCPYPRYWCRLRTSSRVWTHAVAKFKAHRHAWLYVHGVKSPLRSGSVHCTVNGCGRKDIGMRTEPLDTTKPMKCAAIAVVTSSVLIIIFVSKDSIIGSGFGHHSICLQCTRQGAVLCVCGQTDRANF